LLDLNPAFVVACIHAERAKRDEERNMWHNIAQRMAAVAVTLLMFVSLTFATLGNVIDNNSAGAASVAAAALFLLSILRIMYIM
jgi:hypothetical protein